MALLDQIEERPVLEQVENIVHRQVRERQKDNATATQDANDAGGADRGVGRDSAGLFDLGQLHRRNRRMLGRLVSPVPPPHGDQRQGRQRREEQRALPAEGLHQDHQYGRRQRGADLHSEGMEPLRKGPPVGRQPGFHDTGAYRHEWRVSAAQNELRGKQHDEQ